MHSSTAVRKSLGADCSVSGVPDRKEQQIAVETGQLIRNYLQKRTFIECRCALQRSGEANYNNQTHSKKSGELFLSSFVLFFCSNTPNKTCASAPSSVLRVELHVRVCLHQEKRSAYDRNLWMDGAESVYVTNKQ